MNHKELVKEFREIRKYLEKKAQRIKTRYGENPEFANDMDKWHFELLMQVCRTVQEPESVTPYFEVQVPEMGFAPNKYGIEI